VYRNDCELTSNAEVRASSGSEDAVDAATKRNSPHGLVFDLENLKVNVTEPMDHCNYDEHTGRLCIVTTVSIPANVNGSTQFSAHTHLLRRRRNRCVGDAFFLRIANA
jgi:hypothetical protein